MLKRFFLVLVFLGVCFFVFRPFLPNFSLNRVQKSLQQVPQEDQIILEQFFKMLMLHEGGAFVIFGDKPMMVVDFLIDCDEDEMTDFFYPDRLSRESIYRLGWQRWKKYAHLFPSKRFILKGTRVDDFLAIDLISVKGFKRVFQKHENDFKRVLGKDITFKRLLRRYMNENIDAGSLLNDHDGLYGTLLGYGRDNAWLFYQMNHSRSDVDSCRFSLRTTQTPFSGFKTIEEERSFYEQKLQSFDTKYQHLPINLIQLPQFRANLYSKETKRLKEKYKEQRKKIADIYRHGNFLEITLGQFTSP